MAQPDLLYYLDSQPGIARRKRGAGWQYIAPDGTTIDRSCERQRLNALAVPPAYKDVWLSPHANGHLQATGRDARHRKQYRYHVDWAQARSETKFAQLTEFGEALPRIRRRVNRDLQEDAGEQVFALAAATLLIDRASLRVGSPDYTEENGSYGAITLRNRHVQINNGEVSLAYKAKGGTKVQKTVVDKSLARALQKSNDLPGAELFTWTDAQDAVHALTSDRLNRYIGEAAEMEAATAKTFRTWAGTVAGFAVAEKGDATIKDISEAAAKRLHNTPTIARSSYIHPAVIDLANNAPLNQPTRRRDMFYAVETRLLDFLVAA